MTKRNSSTPAPGWWAVQHHVGNDRRLALLPPDKVLTCLGLLIAATGWSIAFETEIVSEADLTRHAIVGAASTASVIEAAKLLVQAGIWTEIPGVGFDTGAAEHITAKQDRIDKALAAVKWRELQDELERRRAGGQREPLRPRPGARRRVDRRGRGGRSWVRARRAHCGRGANPPPEEGRARDRGGRSHGSCRPEGKRSERRGG